MIEMNRAVAVAMAYVQWTTTRWYLEDDAVRVDVVIRPFESRRCVLVITDLDQLLGRPDFRASEFALIGIFFLGPLAVMLAYSLARRGAYGTVEWVLGLASVAVPYEMRDLPDPGHAGELVLAATAPAFTTGRLSMRSPAR
mgnify:CR=1 FL=1